MEKPSIIRAFETAYVNAKERDWDKIYIAVDIHDTMLVANFDSERSIESLPRDWLPGAKEVVQIMSDRKDIHLILNTCSYPKEIAEYVKFFSDEGIEFKEINCNSEVMSTRHGFFREKMYVNVYLDDKAGFRYTDWPSIKEFLIKQPEL